MQSGEPITLSSYARLLGSNSNFRHLWYAQIVSEIGDWLYIIAIYSHLLELTGGAAKSIGFAFVLQVLPQMLTAPVAGVLNDRLSRRRMMIATDWMRALIISLMLFAQSADMIWFIYLLLFLETVCWGLFEPARNATIPNVTTGQDLFVANALSSTTWSFNFAVGSAIGGFIAAFAGKQAAFVINALSFVASALLISRTRFDEPHLKEHPPFQWKQAREWRMVAEGWNYVNRDRKLVVILLAKCGLGFLGANWVLLTILGERKYPVYLWGLDAQSAGMMGMSFLMGARGLGALVGPLLGSYFAGSSQERMRRGISLGFALAAFGYILLGLSHHMLAACFSVILAHAGGSTIWVFSTNLLQLNTEDRFRGRIFSAEFSFMTLSMSASSSLSGILIDQGIAPEAVAVGAGLTMFVPGALWVAAQRLWRIGHQAG
ncbi:MAG: MFS transporter [Bryobacteraceae bacterium]|nr:MFS transporter [Bryobacteraceae bacterium]MDW8379554.1 MFS transporter [Bryobacterales bacterium]